MKKNNMNRENRKTTVPALQERTEEADALRTHMKPADFKDEGDAVLLKDVQQVETLDFPQLQKEPLERPSLQDQKGDNDRCSSSAEGQIPEPESPWLRYKEEMVWPSVRERVALLRQEEQLKDLPKNHKDRTTSDRTTSDRTTSDMDLDLVKVSKEEMVWPSVRERVALLGQEEQLMDLPKKRKDRTTSDRTTSERTHSDMTTSDRTTSERTHSERTHSDRTTSDRTTSYRTTSDRTHSDMTHSERTHSDRTTSDRTTSDRTTSDMDLDLVKVSKEEMVWPSVRERVALLGQEEQLMDLPKKRKDRKTSYRTTSDRTTSDRTTSDRTTSDRTTSDRTTSDRTTSDMDLDLVKVSKEEMVWPSVRERVALLGQEEQLMDLPKKRKDRKTSYRTTSDRTTSDRTTSDRTTSDRTTSDRTTSDMDLDLVKVSSELETAEVAVTEISRPMEAVDVRKEKQTETNEDPDQPRVKQVLLSLVPEDLQNPACTWEQDRTILLGEISRLRAGLDQAHMALENQKHQPSLKAEVIPDANKDHHQCEDKNSRLLAEAMEEISTITAALNETREDLKTQKQEWEKVTSNLLSEQEETCRLKAALTQVQEDLKTQKDKSSLLEETTSKTKTALTQAQEDLKTQKDKSSLLEETTSKTKTALTQAREELETKESQWDAAKFKLVCEHVKERESLQTAQKQAEEDLRRQWEMDRCCLLAEHQEETIRMQDALKQAKEDLQTHQAEWQQEKASLMESLTAINKSLKEQQEDRAKTTNSFMDRLRSLETQLEEASRPPKKSFKKRFLQFFRRDARTPSQTSDTLSQDPSTSQSSSHSHQPQQVQSSLYP
ncbi:coiled-coil domain-containing protein 186-like isoform X11 [Notolabrus celidotus]|uniref:coiled-coil domain-containing protein 186-like isoform X11 n=1 Tax=Notolabrus celidotus TaxID=1203425 RepID=UPI00148F8E3F|nr:coiled-coil domain-containing protein 186-like isoform X11 [Notolabrus celidotus]